MRVPTSTFTDRVALQLQQLSAQQSQLQNQISTGQRITDPSDDPAAMSRLLRVEAQKQQVQQFARNQGRALNISQATFSSLSGLKTISDRAGELSVLGSGVLTGQAAQAYATEVNQMIEQALQTGNTSFGNEHLFAGTKTDTAPYVAARNAAGEITSVNYVGAANGPAFQTSEGTQISPYTTGAENQHTAEFINNLVALRDALRSGNATAVQTTRPALQTSEDNLLVSISGVGAIQTRLEADGAQNASRFLDLDKLVSQDTDVDLATTLVKFQQTQNAYQAALQTGAQVMRLSLLDYLR